MAVVGIAGVAAVGVSSPATVVDAAKDVVTVRAEAATMVPPLIRRTPDAKAVLRSTRRPGATTVGTVNSRAAVARGANALMAPLLKRRNARGDPVGIMCPEITLVRNAASV